MLSGCSTVGRLACPYCMKNTDMFTLEKSGKQPWYENHHTFLPVNHAIQNNKGSLKKNKIIIDGPPEVRLGKDILNHIEALGL